MADHGRRRRQRSRAISPRRSASRSPAAGRRRSWWRVERRVLRAGRGPRDNPRALAASSGHRRAALAQPVARLSERGRSHRQQRVFETPEVPRLPSSTSTGSSWAGSDIVSVMTPVPVDEPHGDAGVLAAARCRALGMVSTTASCGSAREPGRRAHRDDPGRTPRRAIAEPSRVSPAIVGAVEQALASGEPVGDGVGRRRRPLHLLTMFPAQRRRRGRTGRLLVPGRVRPRLRRARACGQRAPAARDPRQHAPGRGGPASRIATEPPRTVQGWRHRSWRSTGRRSSPRRQATSGWRRRSGSPGRRSRRRPTGGAAHVRAAPAVLHNTMVWFVAAMRLLAGQIAQEVGATSQVVGPTAATPTWRSRSSSYRLGRGRRTRELARGSARRARSPSTSPRPGGARDEVATTLRVHVEDVRSRPGAALHLGLDSMAERVRAAAARSPPTPARRRDAALAVLEQSPQLDVGLAPKGWGRSPGSGAFGHALRGTCRGAADYQSMSAERTPPPISPTRPRPVTRRARQRPPSM